MSTKNYRSSIRFSLEDTAEDFLKRFSSRVFIDEINDQRRMQSLWTN